MAFSGKSQNIAKQNNSRGFFSSNSGKIIITQDEGQGEYLFMYMSVAGSKVMALSSHLIFTPFVVRHRNFETRLHMPFRAFTLF